MVTVLISAVLWGAALISVWIPKGAALIWGSALIRKDTVIQIGRYALTWKHCPSYQRYWKISWIIVLFGYTWFYIVLMSSVTFGSTFTFNFKSPFPLSTNSCFLPHFCCLLHHSHLFILKTTLHFCIWYIIFF